MDRTVKRFWSVVTAMSPKEKAALLRFVTSCERPPPLGFESMQPPFCVHRVGIRSDGERLPTASTCFNTLKLPTYSSEKVGSAVSSNRSTSVSGVVVGCRGVKVRPSVACLASGGVCTTAVVFVFAAVLLVYVSPLCARCYGICCRCWFSAPFGKVAFSVPTWYCVRSSHRALVSTAS